MVFLEQSQKFKDIFARIVDQGFITPSFLKPYRGSFVRSLFALSVSQRVDLGGTFPGLLDDPEVMKREGWAPTYHVHCQESMLDPTKLDDLPKYESSRVASGRKTDEK